MKKKGKAPKPKAKPRKAQRAPEDKPLSKYETRFVTAFAGNQREAAIAAGSKPKSAGAIGNRVFHRPNVQKAIRQKQDAFLAGVGEQQSRGVTVTRNDIINRLDDLSQTADSDSTRVSALRELVDIFGLSSKYSDHDPFAGWTIEELEEFHRSGRWPDRYATPPVDSGNEG
jgi:terminase small subunit-like protein